MMSAQTGTDSSAGDGGKFDAFLCVRKAAQTFVLHCGPAKSGEAFAKMQ